MLHLPELGLKFDEGKVKGIDFSHYAVTTAHEEVRPHLVEADIAELDFIPDKSYDLIFSNDVLEHLTEGQIRSCLLHCQRIAKKRIVHLISIGDGANMPLGVIPEDQDQSHITLRSYQWWVGAFHNIFDDVKTKLIKVEPHGRTIEIVVDRRP